MKITALIVEDNQALSEAFTIALSDIIGFDTVTLNDGQAALTYLQRQRPDFLLLDLHLPNVSGREILDYLSQYPAPHQPVVLIVTADVLLGEEILQNFTLVRKALFKPFTLTQLAGTVQELAVLPHASIAQ
ncbi:MAG: response regulator [Anaerolineales bacterium]|nr:response regulator [Anaerolineales bacterium]MCB0026563.1 response regulator [Anaerolineales bacterium]